jgi:hypothetical protein
MQPTHAHLRLLVTRLWRADAPLTAVGLIMIAALAAFTLGLWLDPRTIAGAPAWLKPAKFAASIAIYTLTLAWVFTYLPAWTRTRYIVGRVTAVTMLIEIGIIGGQAWRGTTSHFNVGTVVDGVLFTIMGVAIVVQTLTSVAVAVALWRQTFADRALGWALRLGLTLTIAGAFTGGLMTRPTEAQLAEARTTRLAIAGAHTVGAPDGGPGLLGTGWSLEHGDLRVPHFLGLHALQALALLALATPRRWSEARRLRVTFIAAASYTSLFGILLVQALSGEPVAAPGTITLVTLAAWAALTGGAVWLSGGSRSSGNILSAEARR